MALAFKKYEMAFYNDRGVRYSFDGLLVRFNIVHTKNISANVGKFEVFNLSAEGQAALLGAEYIEFHCGYDGDVHLAFIGDLDEDSFDSIPGLVDHVTKFVAYDGKKALADRVQLSAKAVGGKNIVEAILAEGPNIVASGLTIDSIKKGATNVTRAVAGTVVSNLNDVVGENGDVYISDGELRYLEKNATIQDHIAEFWKKVAKFTFGKAGNIVVETHLRPSIRPGQFFSANGGNYLVNKNTISGDTRGGPWSSKIEGRAL